MVAAYESSCIASVHPNLQKVALEQKKEGVTKTGVQSQETIGRHQVD